MMNSILNIYMMPLLQPRRTLDTRRLVEDQGSRGKSLPEVACAAEQRRVLKKFDYDVLQVQVTNI